MSESPFETFCRQSREKLEAALALPLPETPDDVGVEGYFDPWENVIHGIHGLYSSECDDLMISTLEAVRDRKTFELIAERGFVVEFMLYVLSGHGLIEYGTSPRGGWPAHEDLWDALIDKWKTYRNIMWED